MIIAARDAHELVNKPVHRIVDTLIDTINETIQPLHLCVAADVCEEPPKSLLG
jgi:hypothetical protein